MRALGAGLLLMWTGFVHAQEASVPYTPSLLARHHLQLLADQAGMKLPVTHWPQPLAAVEQALDSIPEPEAWSASRQAVLREVRALHDKPELSLNLRGRAEGLTGFDEQYTPGSSLAFKTDEGRWDLGELSTALKLGVRVEQNSNSLLAQPSGWGLDGARQVRPDDTAAVLGLWGWNVQAFAHRNWWGPGWQSSLVNGHNTTPWMGVGLQRGSSAPSSSKWLHWMGPWSLDVFVAKAQDPIVTTGQASGYLFSGMRLTLKPTDWLEVGLSRGLQTGGAGRPGGLSNFVKAFFGQNTNKWEWSPYEDSSNQLAGYDVRVRCPKSLGACAVYGQMMGEDSAGEYPPLPYRFMHLVGFEQVLGQGRHRVFVEYADTHVPQLFNSSAMEPGYVNAHYRQGYTNGARWIGSAQGGASRVTTLGWLDAELHMLVKVHYGTVGMSLGSYDPEANAPHGKLKGLTAQKTFEWRDWRVTPELSVMRLSDGGDTGANKRNNTRLGVEVAMPLSF